MEKTLSCRGVFVSWKWPRLRDQDFKKGTKKQLKIFHSTRITQVEETPPAWGSLVTKILPRQRHGTKCTNSFLALKDHIPLTPSDLCGIPLAVDLLHKFLLRCKINTVLFTSTPPPKKKKLWEAVFNLWMRNQTKKRKLHLLFKPSMIVPFLYLNKRKRQHRKGTSKRWHRTGNHRCDSLRRLRKSAIPHHGGTGIGRCFLVPPYGSLYR